MPHPAHRTDDASTNASGLYVGLMSGTSLDGIDAALVDIDARGRPTLLGHHAEPMPSELRQRLWALCHASSAGFDELAAAEDAFCALQAKAVAALLANEGIDTAEIVALGSHGQTIEHAPNGHAATPDAPAYTLQLDNPSLLAELTGCTVVADFRRRDLAAGGQAAPLAPAFHHALFADDQRHRLILNLGGFANVTSLPPSGGEVIGFDSGPANALLDGWYARHHDGHFDAEGAWAAQGRIDYALLRRMLDDAFFHQPPPRSTGREHFHLDWLAQRLRGDERPVDVQATLAELTAASVAGAVALLGLGTQTLKLIAAGGGVHNTHLMARLQARLPQASLTTPDAYGWPGDWIEAGAFAWLAYRRLQGLPGNLPSVTGARGPRLLGGVYAA